MNDAASNLWWRFQFASPDQQRQAASLGMWVFLATEVLFFGALLTAYAMYRIRYPADFQEASTHLYLSIGAVNTLVLLGSSLAVALAVRRAGDDNMRAAGRMLLCAAVLGVVFLSLKMYEYRLDYHEQLVPVLRFEYRGAGDPAHVKMFMMLYFIATGIHAMHLSAGVAMLMGLWLMNRRGRFSAEHHTPIEMVGLYWHFVDIVWVFLLPLLYMVGAP